MAKLTKYTWEQYEKDEQKKDDYFSTANVSRAPMKQKEEPKKEKEVKGAK